MKDKIREYLTAPTTWISLIVFVFGLGTVWSSMNSRIDNLEKSVNEIDVVSIQSQLSQIQTDLAWIRNALQK